MGRRKGRKEGKEEGKKRKIKETKYKKLNKE